MTDQQAEDQLSQLRDEKCICGAEELQVLNHNSKCPYRMAAFLKPALRRYIGPLYSAGLPEAA